MTGPDFGKLITDPQARRDAVHVAVIPATAPCVLQPGQRLQSGVVDPFLTESVQPGQRYWLFLFPGTVTGIRHVWSAPAFPEEASS